jgi:hypothetical protein
MNTVTSVKDNNESAIDLYGKENLFCMIWEIKKRQTDYIITKMGLGGPSLAYCPTGSQGCDRIPWKSEENRSKREENTSPYLEKYHFLSLNLDQIQRFLFFPKFSQ